MLAISCAGSSYKDICAFTFINCLGNPHYLLFVYFKGIQQFPSYFYTGIQANTTITYIFLHRQSY